MCWADSALNLDARRGDPGSRGRARCRGGGTVAQPTSASIDRRCCTASLPRRRWQPERRDRKLPSGRRSEHCEDPRGAVDLQLVDDLDRVKPDDPRQSPQTLPGEAPVDEVIARVYVAPVVN